MKVLIFTGAFGMGHYSVAKAVKEEILKDNPCATVIIIDMIEYIFPKISKLIYGTFNFMVRKFSFIYNFFNKIISRRTSTPLKKFVIKKLDLLFEDNDIDMIISTFPVCSQYISMYKKMKNYHTPLYTYITDLGVNEEWICEKTNMYFVGSEKTKKFLIDKNLPKEKIIVSGIPVKQDFKEKNVIKQLNKKKEILVMGGGLGLVPCSIDLLKEISKEEDIKITFIAGKNKILLEEIKKECPKINVLGYTDKISEYMRKSDLIITKAGGITLFEAIFSEIPIYVIKPFLYQEIENAKYIEDTGIGKVIWHNGTDIYEDVTSLIKNELLLEVIKTNIRNEKSKLENVSPLNYYNGGEELCY